MDATLIASYAASRERRMYADALSNHIIASEMSPGPPLDEIELAQRLGRIVYNVYVSMKRF